MLQHCAALLTAQTNVASALALHSPRLFTSVAFTTLRPSQFALTRRPSVATIACIVGLALGQSLCAAVAAARACNTTLVATSQALRQR